MHERELVEEVLETLRSLAGDEPIGEVEIALGRQVDREEAIRSWNMLTQGTELEGTRVIWERAFDLLHCADCGHDYTGDGLDPCPYCGSDGVVIETAPPVSLGRWVIKEGERQRLPPRLDPL